MVRCIKPPTSESPINDKDGDEFTLIQSSKKPNKPSRIVSKSPKCSKIQGNLKKEAFSWFSKDKELKSIPKQAYFHISTLDFNITDGEIIKYVKQLMSIVKCNKIRLNNHLSN